MKSIVALMFVFLLSPAIASACPLDAAECGPGNIGDAEAYVENYLSNYSLTNPHMIGALPNGTFFVEFLLNGKSTTSGGLVECSAFYDSSAVDYPCAAISTGTQLNAVISSVTAADGTVTRYVRKVKK